MQEALIFLVRALVDLYLLTFLLRLALQWVRGDFSNPLAQFIVKVTNPLVIPARRIIPTFGGIDTPTILVLVVLQAVATTFLMFMIGFQITPTTVAWFTLLRLVASVLWFYFISILICVILSWVAQGYHPVAALLGRINEPLLRPIRRLVPPISGIDLSPLFVLLLITALRIALGLPRGLA